MNLIGLLILAVIFVCGWALLVRPVFERMGWLKPLPSGIAAWRDRISGWARHSATVALGKLQLWFGALLELSLQLGDVLNVPGLREQLESAGLGRGFAIALIVVGIVTILARTRKGSTEPV